MKPKKVQIRKRTDDNAFVSTAERHPDTMSKSSSRVSRDPITTEKDEVKAAEERLRKKK